MSITKQLLEEARRRPRLLAAALKNAEERGSTPPAPPVDPSHHAQTLPPSVADWDPDHPLLGG